MRLRISFLLFFTAGFLLPHSLCAQTSATRHQATIRGAVFDPDGRAVPDAEVTLLGSMIVSSGMRTDSHGQYRFDGLAAGDYTIVANVPGFSSVSTDIKLAGDADLASDLRLKLSAVEEQVVVSASLGGALAPEVGSSVTVVGSDEIENQGAETIADALRNVPGVAVNRTGQKPLASQPSGATIICPPPPRA